MITIWYHNTQGKKVTDAQGCPIIDLSLVEDLDLDHSILNLSTKPTDTHGLCSPTQSYDKTSQYKWSVAGYRTLLGRFRSPALCHVLLSTGSPLPRRTVGRCSPSMVQVVQILKNDLFGMHLPLGSLFPISLYLSTGVEQYGVFPFTLAWP